MSSTEKLGETTDQLITRAPLRLLGLNSAQNSGVTEALAPRARLLHDVSIYVEQPGGKLVV